MADEVGDTFDKIKAGAKAVAKKVIDPNRHSGTEYEKESWGLRMRCIWKQ